MIQQQQPVMGQAVMGQAVQNAPVSDPFGDGLDSLVCNGGLFICYYYYLLLFYFYLPVFISFFFLIDFLNF